MTKDEEKAKKAAEETKAAQKAADKAAQEAKAAHKASDKAALEATKAKAEAESARNDASKKSEAAQVAADALTQARADVAKAVPPAKAKARRAVKLAQTNATKANTAAKKAKAELRKKEGAQAKAEKAAEKAAQKAKEADEKATEATGKIQAAGPAGGRVNLTFYNAATLARISPSAQELAKAQIELLQGDGSKLKPVQLLSEPGKDGKTVVSYINAPPWTSPPEGSNKGQGRTEKVELPCDVPRELPPALVIKRFTESLTYNCCSYQMQEIVTDYPGSEQGACTPVNIGLVELEESYNFKLLAFDQCIGDYISNPKALINNVRLDLREVETSKVSGQGIAFEGRSFSAITEQGYAVISGLEFGRVYEPKISAPPGYFCTNPPPARISFCSGQDHGWEAAFQPCGQFPSRSIIFVQQSCPGARVPNLSIRTGQGDWTTDPYGVCNLNATTTGTIIFQAVGKVFSPPSIELTKDSPLVFVVGVAEGTATQMSHRVADRDDLFIVAFEKAPPADTEVAVRRLNGDHVAYLRPNEDGEYTYPAQPDDIFDFVVLRSGKVIDSARLKA